MVSGNGKLRRASNARIPSEMKFSDLPSASEKPGLMLVITTRPEPTTRAMTTQSTELLATISKYQNAATSLKLLLFKEKTSASQSGSAVPKRLTVSINTCGCLRKMLPAKTVKEKKLKETHVLQVFHQYSVVPAL